MCKQPAHAKVFVEIFSGCGQLARSVARFTTWVVLVWDITLGAQYDLGHASNRRLIGEWIKCGMVVGFHLGTPCESFTRARDVPPGPPPLRSDAQPLGLPNLAPHDEVKVRLGNIWMRFSAWLLRLALVYGTWATLENPATSRLWICPPLVSLRRRRRVHVVTTHYCFWGRPFRKATSFLSVNFELTRLVDALCHSTKRGICGHTGMPHIQLCGRDAKGQWLTRMGQPYPIRLCNAIAKCYYDAEAARKANNFSHYGDGFARWLASMGHHSTLEQIWEIECCVQRLCVASQCFRWQSMRQHLALKRCGVNGA